MIKTIELEISKELQFKGISRITIEGNTIVVEYDNLPIRFDIHKDSWQKTISNFEKISKDVIKTELIQPIITVMSKNWLTIIENQNENFEIPFKENDKETKIIDPTIILQPKIINQDYRTYIINTIKKEVKQEDILIRQIFDAAISAYSSDPGNIGIVAPTSEGKTYTVMKTLQYFPKEDVEFIGSMSPKALIRKNGILVDKNTNKPIEFLIKGLKSQIKKAKSIEEKTTLQEKLEYTIDNSKTLIDLNNTILVFLEPPHKELWTILKPILSHDADEIEYPFVERTDKDGTRTKNIAVRGFPACIFCSAKDESGWSMWPEIQSRFWITSPNMKPAKYYESNLLIGRRKGLPSQVQKILDSI